MDTRNDGIGEEIEMQSVHPTEASVKAESFLQKTTGRITSLVKWINDKTSKSVIGRFFRFEGCGHVRAQSRSFIGSCNPKLTSRQPSKPSEIQDARLSTEIRAGLTTFATMSYIIAVNVSTSSHIQIDRINSSLFSSLPFSPTVASTANAMNCRRAHNRQAYSCAQTRLNTTCVSMVSREISLRRRGACAHHSQMSSST